MSASMGRIALRLAACAAGGFAARAALSRVSNSGYAPALERTNHRGRSVSLAAGPALAVGASLSAAAGAAVEGQPRLGGAALVAGLGSGAVGLYDDVVGARPEQKAAKGFQGHLRALRRGQVTSGLVKIAGVGAASLAAAAMIAPKRPAGRRGRLIEIGLGAGVIAGTANLANLLDLRPGRALKAGMLLGSPLAASAAGAVAAGPVGAAVGLLPDDLNEQVMLGDAGANALGALLGVGIAARCGPWGRAGTLAALAALTAASEKVSFTKVIESTPGLRELDALGRRPR